MMTTDQDEEPVDEALAKQLHDKFEEIQQNFQEVPKMSDISTTTAGSSIVTPAALPPTPAAQRAQQEPLSPSYVDTCSAAASSSAARVAVHQMQKDVHTVQRLNELLQPVLPVEATLRPPAEGSLNISLNETTNQSGQSSSSKQTAASTSDAGSFSCRTLGVAEASAPSPATSVSAATPNSLQTTESFPVASALTGEQAPVLLSPRPAGQGRPAERRLCSHCQAMHCNQCGCRPILVAILIICIGLCLYLKLHRPS